MSGAISNGDTVNLFKECYGDLQDHMPEDFPLQKDIPYSPSQKVGEKFVEAVVLTFESGISLLGSTMDAFELNSAVAGSVKQAEVTPYQTVLRSVIPYGVISRSAGGGKVAFFDATKYLVKNNIRSHSSILEMIRLYGQYAGLLGYVSYYSGSYRGVALTNGTGTVNGIAFTNGINAAGGYILFQKGYFAAGNWVAREGIVVQQVSTTAVVGEGKLLAVEPDYGYIQVDFTPTAASSATSHRMCLKGMLDAKEAIGAFNIMTNATTLFGISTSSYSLWKGNVVSCNNTKFSLAWLQLGVAQAVARGGLDGDLIVYVNPRTWSRLVVTEAGMRMYDSSYKGGSEAENGFESICFYHQTGKATVKAHRYMMEGFALAIHQQDWSRSGSAGEISFNVPGIDKDLIYPAENTSAYIMQSYSDQYLFNHAPARSILFTQIDDEAAT
jgi:hypothetical protein